MSFTTFKDRAWKGYDWIARQLFKLPPSVTRAGFSSLGGILWLGWVVPKSPLSRSFRALAEVTGRGTPFHLFRKFVSGFTLTLYRFERLREGDLGEFGDMLRIPEVDRLEAVLSKGGALLMMPHAHGSISTAEALGQKYPLTLVVRTAKDDARAAHQLQYYAGMSCDIIDVRRTEDVAVTRGVIRALRQGRLVLAAGDLVKAAPKKSIDERKDLVRVAAFGQPVGALGWPARFAQKARVPVIPVMMVQGKDELRLLLGPEIESDDLQLTTQAWMDGMLELVCQHPADWTFALDKRWMQALESANAEKFRANGQG